MRKLFLCIFMFGSMGLTQAAETRPSWMREEPEPEKKFVFEEKSDFESYSEGGFEDAAAAEKKRAAAEQQKAELEREEEKKPFLGFSSPSQSTVASRSRPSTPPGQKKSKKEARRRRRKEVRRRREWERQHGKLQEIHAQEQKEAAAYQELLEKEEQEEEWLDGEQNLWSKKRETSLLLRGSLENILSNIKNKKRPGKIPARFFTNQSRRSAALNHFSIFVC